MKHNSQVRWFFFCWLSLMALLPFIVAGLPVAAAEGRVEVLYFYSATCEMCRITGEEVLAPLQVKYGRRLDIKKFEITELDNFKKLLALEQSLGREISKAPPLIFVGRDVLTGEATIRRELEGLIQKHLVAGAPSVPAGAQQVAGESLLQTSFARLSLLAVAGGGLLDGINPCAFATLIFLISYLTFLGKRRQELLLTGALFTVGVFIAYLLIGLGLLELLKRISYLGTIRWGINLFLTAVLIGLGAVSLVDGWRIRKGDTGNVQLQLSQKWKQRIHRVIRERSGAGVGLSGLAMGFLVSCLEFPCTGQIYLPIVAMLRGGSIANNHAVYYLLLYNLMFVIPLIGVFILVYLGMTSEWLGTLMQRHVGKVKLFTGFFFWGLAALIWILR